MTIDSDQHHQAAASPLIVVTRLSPSSRLFTLSQHSAAHTKLPLPRTMTFNLLLGTDTQPKAAASRQGLSAGQRKR
jgi:hypothetical protein